MPFSERAELVVDFGNPAGHPPRAAAGTLAHGELRSEPVRAVRIATLLIDFGRR